MKKQTLEIIIAMGILFQFFPSSKLHSQGLYLVSDTIDLVPGIPKTVDILANDSIPLGDSIRIGIDVYGTNGYIRILGFSCGSYTFVANQDGAQWGAASQYRGGYTVVDYTTGNYAGTGLIFRIRDLSYDSLYLNNINARFNACGNHFWGLGQEYPRFEVPKFSGKTTIFSSALWIGGLDQNSILHLAAERYRQATGSHTWRYADYWAGPVMDSTAYSIYQDTLWNYIWNIKKSDILYHNLHWADPGYQPIHDILTWPGNGDVSLGQAAQLAPYFDRSGDGIYNSMDGDYPLIRGDQSLFFIFNDDRNLHAETGGVKMKVEIHGMAYAFDLPEDSAFNNTIFLNYKIFNRSDKTYYNTYLGIFTDLDIGYANDDFTGCDVERSMYFGYNGVPVDGSGMPEAYGANPPAQSVSIIGGPFMDADGLDNPRFNGNGDQLCNESVNGINFGDTIIDNERLGMTKFIYLSNATGGTPYYLQDPSYAPQYYNYLKGIWLDSTQMIYGGNGHLNGGGNGPECNFMFPGESDSLNWGVGCMPPNGWVDWTETTAGNYPGDRRGLGSSGPFTFQAGAVQELDLAFSFARDYTSKSALGSLAKLRIFTDTIRKSFASNTLPNGNSFNGIYEKTGVRPLSVKLFPNPASTNVNLQFDRTLNEPVNVRIYNETGLLVREKSRSSEENMISLDLGGLSSGLYLILIETKNQAVTKKLSVVR